MRVVGLVSGGKDSIWNLHYCHYLQHEVLCLAHLAPPDGVQEMDSYMYQTVGSELVDSIAQAMELPLIRRGITGAPKNLENGSYAPQEGDEVEDLFLLLQDVLQAFPEVDAVSCGAILSDYQRCRVENVCNRLGLKVLAFLWRQEQPLLLKQMIEGGLDARIVKVACMGLDERHIGKSILDTNFAAHVMQLGKKWGVHVCGEGGEYESAVFDAPLFHRRLALPEGAMEACAHPSGEADDVALMAVREAPVLEIKERDLTLLKVLEDYHSLRYYRDTFAPLSDERLDELVAAQDSFCWCRSTSSSALPGKNETTWNATEIAAGPVLKRIGSMDFFGTSNLDVMSMQLQGRWDSAAAQCDALLQEVSKWLISQERCLRDVAFAEVQVSDLSCFEAVNAVYARHFEENPPARVCIETPLPRGIDVRLRLLLRPHQGASPRDALRVQSISTWAMACIGPYSQVQRPMANMLCSSGVLGLVPHSMSLPAALEGLQQYEAELWMLMRSLHNVLQVMGSGFQEISLAQVYATAGVDSTRLCRQVLAYFLEMSSAATPLIAFSQVPRLPKDACVEIAVLCNLEKVKIVEAAAPSVTELLSVVERSIQALVKPDATSTPLVLDALQVQFCPSTAEPQIQQAVQATLLTLDAMSCALSLMPVCKLGSTDDPEIRFLGFVSEAPSMAGKCSDRLGR